MLLLLSENLSYLVFGFMEATKSWCTVDKSTCSALYHLRILVSLNNASQNPLSCLRLLRQENFLIKSKNNQ